MRYCKGCGRRLRTGIKWCYDCKNGGRMGKKLQDKRNIELGLWWIFILGGGSFYLTYYFFGKGMISRSLIFGAIGCLIFWLGFKDNNERARRYVKEYKNVNSPS